MATIRAISLSSRSAAAAPCTRRALGAELGVKKVVIPRAAPVFSAWGMMMSDLRRDYFITRLIETAGVESSAVVAALTALIEEAAQRAMDQFRG